MKKRNGRDLLTSISSTFLILFFICIQFHNTRGEDLISNECLDDSVIPVCYSVSYYDSNCKELVGELNVNGVFTSGETSIQSIIGGGKKNIVCESVLGQNFCIVAKDVQEEEGGYSVCLELQSKVFQNSIIVSHELGCYDVNCDGSCEKPCQNGGVCRTGICVCPENYFGDDCSVEVNGGCLQSDNTPTICANVTNDNCNFDINFNIEGNSNQTWVATLRTPDQQYCSEKDGCNVCFSLSDITVTKDNTSFCLSVSLSCLNNSTYTLECYNFPCPGDCAYSTNDYDFTRGVNYIANITKGNWYYGYYEQDRDYPIIDLSLSGSVQSGIVRIYERWNCRPTAQYYDSSDVFRSPYNFTMNAITESCTQRLSELQLNGKFYFGFYCSPEGEDCHFNFQIYAHFLEYLTINEKSMPHVVIGNSYYYFEITPSYYPINVTIINQHTNLFPTPVKAYFAVNQCATSSNHFAELSTITHSSYSLQTTDNYTLTLDPTGQPYLVGQLVSIYVEVTSSCTGYLCSTIWAYYEPNDDYSLPPLSYLSYPYSYITGLPSIGSLYGNSDGTGLPSDGSDYYSDGTGLPNIGSSQYTDLTGLPSFITYYYSYITGLPSIGSLYGNSDGTGLPSDGSENYSVATFIPTIGTEQTSTSQHGDHQSSSSNGGTIISAFSSSTNILPPPNGSNSTWWIILAVLLGLIVLVAIVIIAAVIIKIVTKKKKKQFYFDEDGLLGDEEDDL